MTTRETSFSSSDNPTLAGAERPETPAAPLDAQQEERIGEIRKTIDWIRERGHLRGPVNWAMVADDMEFLMKLAGSPVPAASAPSQLCETCAHLTPFELTDELFSCPVVNIRIHRESAAVFGCNQWESK